MKSPLPQTLSKFIEALDKHPLTLEGNQIRDQDVVIKLDYTIITRISWWLQEFIIADDRNELYNQLMDFNPIIDSILIDSYTQYTLIIFRMK